MQRKNVSILLEFILVMSFVLAGCHSETESKNNMLNTD